MYSPLVDILPLISQLLFLGEINCTWVLELTTYQVISIFNFSAKHISAESLF